MCFHRLTEEHGREVANHAISLLRSVYLRPCVDHDGLRNPVEQWLGVPGCPVVGVVPRGDVWGMAAWQLIYSSW